jgi:hypothetical protein
MLESDMARPAPRKPPRRPEPLPDSGADNSRDHSPAVPSRLRQQVPTQPPFLRGQESKVQPKSQSRISLNRQAIEDQASQAYVSSARRRKPPSKPAVSASEPDLLEGRSQVRPAGAPRPATTRPAQAAPNVKQGAPVPVRSPPPLRSIPSVPSISLKAFHADRETGNANFKRGDYSAAHNHIPLL